MAAVLVIRGPADRSAQYATVTLLSGEVVSLGRDGDLGKWNAGLLIFVKSRERPEQVAWADVARVDFYWALEKQVTGGIR